MVSVAQLVEHQVVVLGVMGSIPITHPTVIQFTAYPGKRFSSMAHSLIWGVILLLLGLSLIIKTIFSVSIPLLRAALGAGLVYAGFIMITALEGDNNADQKTITFASEHIKANNPLEKYNISFARGIIDFSKMRTPRKVQKVTVKNILGCGAIKLNPDIPTKIVAKSALGNTELPNQTNVVWGKKVYRTDESNRALLELTVENALGYVQIG